MSTVIDPLIELNNTVLAVVILVCGCLFVFSHIKQILYEFGI